MFLYTAKSCLNRCHVPLRLADGKRYGLYGGSFNPIHEGHKAVAGYALKSLGLHKIIWLVTPHNPFKDIAIYAPFLDRISQAKKQITNPHYIISDIEQMIQSKNTYQTLIYLKKLYPNVKFTYIIGSDSMSHLHKWHFFKEMSQLVTFAIIVRITHRFCINGFGAIRYFKHHNIHYDILLKPFQLISSTDIRNKKV
jgi:nicotinate-nucleotide adenylyltransferase